VRTPLLCARPDPCCCCCYRPPHCLLPERRRHYLRYAGALSFFEINGPSVYKVAEGVGAPGLTDAAHRWHPGCCAAAALPRLDSLYNRRWSIDFGFGDSFFMFELINSISGCYSTKGSASGTLELAAVGGFSFPLPGCTPHTHVLTPATTTDLPGCRPPLWPERVGLRLLGAAHQVS
jgi:hypothetical protein